MDTLTARELFRKYNHTYAMVVGKSNKTPLVAYFNNFGFNDMDIPFTEMEVINSSGKKTTHVIELKTFDIMPIPNRKMFNFKGKALMFSRVPNRQWRKGIATDNSEIVDLSIGLVDTLVSENLAEWLSPRDILYNLDVMTALFLGAYEVDFKSAIKKVCSTSDKTISVAMSEAYSIMAYVSEDVSAVLYHYDVPIAFYNKSGTFTLVDKIHLQEVTDFCNRFNVNSKVEV